ncbi:unnamed protein product [Oikopleura dioica]|uniref:CN hydrolase domain-containing protein n=1 Tax=Oikopleura dioica TaxID=34765 RepID=E4WVL6_OIKDI|nr:unnamed protein product [Oikopleura dioica]
MYSKWIKEAAANGAKMVFLPEAYDYIGSSLSETFSQAECVEKGDLMLKMCSIAAENKVWLSLGGAHEKLEELENSERQKIGNAHILIDDVGMIKQKYRKIHLFDAPVVGLKESNWTLAGEKLSDIIPTPVGNLALSICYDLRFPHLSHEYRKRGADVLTFPSAFTVPTGKAHWHTLLRARAIETQCFVVAAAQRGTHNDKRSSYGHSLVVGPWGEVILAKVSLNMNDEIGLGYCELDLEKLEKVRNSMPVLEHFRYDSYNNN